MNKNDKELRFFCLTWVTDHEMDHSVSFLPESFCVIEAEECSGVNPFASIVSVHHIVHNNYSIPPFSSKLPWSVQRWCVNRFIDTDSLSSRCFKTDTPATLTWKLIISYTSKQCKTSIVVVGYCVSFTLSTMNTITIAFVIDIANATLLPSSMYCRPGTLPVFSMHPRKCWFLVLFT